MSLVQAFHDQATACANLGSPFTARVLTILADIWDPTSVLGQNFARYQGDVGPAGHSLPLRLTGALHALVLLKRVPALVALYPPEQGSDASLHIAIKTALKSEEPFILHWTRTAPQTNEVRRSAALIAMAHVALQHFDLPLMLSELGASGGLNLMWDRFALQAGDTTLGPVAPALTLNPDWTGPPPPAATPRVTDRAGVDLNPLNPNDRHDLLRLSAFLWPDQPERLARTRAAAAVFDANLHTGDAIDWLETRLDQQPEGQMHLIQNTVAWQYFPPDAQARGAALIARHGARATAQKPLGWMQMETDGDTAGQSGAALTLRLWPGDMTLPLGRADFHGRWVRWNGLRTQG
ncbi:MAG: DUF2332 family protein [Pseudomonadota bacterium]